MLEKHLRESSNNNNQASTNKYIVNSETEERYFNNSIYPFGFTQFEFKCEANL